MEFNGSDYSILLVDDTQTNLILLKAILKKEAYQLITANSGEEALELVCSTTPDLILLDVMMPRMSGYEVAERLLADPETKDIPIIFLTALDSTTQLPDALAEGNYEFCSKPYNKVVLFERMQARLLQGRV